MPDQEMLEEIKRLLELTLRVDERVKNVTDNQEKMVNRFDKFIDQHSQLIERVAKLEINIFTKEEIEERVGDFEEAQNKITSRLNVVESTAPYTFKIVDQSLEALNKLSDRICKVENEQKNTTQTMDTWKGWIVWGGDLCFKLAWIIIAAYILTRIGLGGVNIPGPF